MIKRKVATVSGGLILCTAGLYHFVCGNEGMRHIAYRDVGGVWTVCNGITGEGVKPYRYYTSSECLALAQQRITEAGKGVLSCVKSPLNQNQYNAFTDLAYNIGVGAFCRSSVAREANKRNYARACDSILLYDKAGGKVLNGLRTRREAERQMCLKVV